MQKKILFVVTNHDKMGDTGISTGYYLAEVSHPWKVLTDTGYEIDFVSPKGGKAPVDGLDLEDPINKLFWENSLYHNKIDDTFRPSEISINDYTAIFYAGGYGTMWDFPENTELAELGTKVYEKGGIIAAVCHGPSALINIKLSSGKYLVDGKRINSFTDNEERAVKLEHVMPFLLESKLIERGAIFEKSDLWMPHISVDQRVITGQNPQSAKAVGEAILTELKK